MNVKQRDDLLQALSDCRPGLKTQGLAKTAAGRRAASWLVGFRAGQPWRELALAQTEPWRAEIWDLAKGRLTASRWSSDWARRPFSPKAFGDAALEQALAAFAALHAPAALLLERRSGRLTGRWALPLADPPAWAHFLRCDVAALFAPDAPLLSLLLRDLAVQGLVFDGAALWAFCG